MATSRRKRPCRKCRRWFWPDARAGDRQRVCGREECQKARRQETQAEWRLKNPGYFIAWRAEERATRSPPDAPEPARVPEPLARLPWRTAQEEFGAVGADFLGSMGRLLVFHAKTQMEAKPSDFTEGFRQHPPEVAKDQMTP